jgi:N-acetylmuramic acid 6-phosphate etherase
LEPSQLTTESRNEKSNQIDSLSTLEIVDLINREDQLVAEAVAAQRQAIATAIDMITARLRQGGRLLYLGAGTSGRLGVLDASECPPTFNTPPRMVVGIIAGGPAALTRAMEGAEDDGPQAIEDLRSHQLNSQDVLIGIATSGRTPYVIAGLNYAKSVGAAAIGLSCNAASEMSHAAELMIVPVVGPEVISGSTRMKAGTATKMVLNMLTTASMVKLGKTYGNLMVDLRATNIKLKERSLRIVQAITGLAPEPAEHVLAECAGEVKTAIVAHCRNMTPEQARLCLLQAEGHLRDALSAD